MIESLALVYSDGAYAVLSQETTLAEALAERDVGDRGERDPARRTKVARVRLEVVEIVADASPTRGLFCAACGRPLVAEAQDDAPLDRVAEIVIDLAARGMRRAAEDHGRKK